MSSGLELILNASTGTPVGGVNTARVQNDVGDLCLWSSNFAGMRISAGTGNVAMTGTLSVAGQLTASNVSVLGTTEIINAYETHSSNVVINNYGTGPALAVMQTETTAQPVAAFYAGSNAALMVTSAGQVGIGKSTAAYALDVSGSVNVSGAITVSGTTVIDASNYFLGLNKYAFAFTSTPISPTTRSAWIAGGLSVSIPISGTYLITYNGRVNNITTSDSWWKMGLWNNRTSSYLNITWGGNISYSSGIGDLGASGSYVATSLLTSDTIRLDYYVAGSGSSTMNFGGDTNGVTTLCALKIA